MKYHTPVLASETLSLLRIQPHKIYIDATIGNGGHSIKILKKGGTVYGLDQDPINLQLTTERIKKLKLNNFHPIHGNFSQLSSLIKKHIKNPSEIRGVLFDLGLSSNQQKSHHRGFSFNDNLSLDMRLDPSCQKTTAEFIINTAPFSELVHLFSFYAQEKQAKPLTIRIINQRQKAPIKSAKRLADIIRQYYKQKNIKTKIDPSTKIFLALKIIVNQEFKNLTKALDQTLSLPPTSVAVFISFHSGEDRIIKRFIKKHQKEIVSLTAKPLKPQQSEIDKNPLSRSAILRAFQILP